jgi:hypothetical protein
MRPSVALGLLALAAYAHADEVRVVSPMPDAVSVTIYRDLFALITETRTVDLPAGPVTLVFDGVAESLLPQSAVITDTGRPLGESNYDNELLTPENLLAKSIGREVLLTRTDPATGRVRQVGATLVAANTGGIIFRTHEGNEALRCSGLPERLSFEEIPGELSARPALSIRLPAGAAGKRQVRISYLAHGFAWSADYVGTLAADSARMELMGWITLQNLTDASFRNAQVQVVAGRLNLLDHEESRGTSLIGATADFASDEYLDSEREAALEEIRDDPDSLPHRAAREFSFFGGCYPLFRALPAFDVGKLPDSILAEALQRIPGVSMDAVETEEVIVTGIRASMAVREDFADYQLYRLPGSTDLVARQTKQVAFLHQRDVAIERFYGLRIANDFQWGNDEAAQDNFIPFHVKVAWRNRKSDGLGEPLPGGVIRFFEPGDVGKVFAGEARIKDTPLDVPVEVTIGGSIDIGVSFDGSDAAPEPRPSPLMRRIYLPVRLRIYNDKPRPVLVEWRQAPFQELRDMRVIDASAAPSRKGGDFMWRFLVPAHGEQALSYKVGGRIPKGWEP